MSKMGFHDSFIVDAQGYSGGLWVLWRDGLGSVSVVDASNQCIHILIDNNGEKLFGYWCVCES